MGTVNNNRLYYLLLFLSPILGGYYAMKNLEWNMRKPVLIVAITIFGATIILPEYADGFRLNEMVENHYSAISFGQWLFELKEMLLFSPEPGTKGDVFSHVLSYIVGGLLQIPKLYFIFVSFIYAYFYVSALSKIFSGNVNPQKSLLAWGLIIVFVFYRSIDALQTVRTWTGLWVLFYGVYGYHETGERKYVFWMLAAPLIHVAYFAMALPAFVVLFIKNWSPKIFVGIYFLSFFLSVNPEGIVNTLKTNELGASKVKNYYREDAADYNDKTILSSSNFYTKYGRDWALTKAPNFMAFALILGGLFKRRRMTKLELGLFSTGLLLASMANFGSFIPAFYNRTMINAGIYITAIPVILHLRGGLLKERGVVLLSRKIFLWLAFLLFVPYLIYVAFNLIQFSSIYLIALPILGVVQSINISMREVVSYLFLSG